MPAGDFLNPKLADSTAGNYHKENTVMKQKGPITTSLLTEQDVWRVIFSGMSSKCI